MTGLTASRLPRRVLVDDVYDALTELLLDQQVEPGARVNVDQLARDLDVSITPLREALVRLESDGLVVKEPHRGYKVTPLLDAASFEELYEMRVLVEPTAARLAAERAGSPHIEDLRRHATAMHDALTGGAYREFGQFAREDALFHRGVAIAAGNRYLVDEVDRLRSHQQLSRLYVHHGVIDAPEAIPEHDLILRAIAHGDGNSAEMLMTAHIQRSRSRLSEILDTGKKDGRAVLPDGR